MNENYEIRESEEFFKIQKIQKYLIGTNGIIAGGCFKNLFNDEPVKDIDMFFRNNEDFAKAKMLLDSKDEDYVFDYENQKVIAYKNKKDNIRIELIRYVYGEPEEILNNFDFTIVKFCLYITTSKNEKDEEENEFSVICHKKFFEHLFHKRLVIDDKCLFPYSTLNRTYKYAKYGYYPCMETKINLIKAIRNSNNEPVIDDIGNSLYDGID